MRGVVFAVLAATALLLGSVGAVGAAPALNANCIADVITSFAPGSLDEDVREAAPGGGIGSSFGEAAPTNCL